MTTCDTLEAAVDALLAHAGPRLVLAAPLGLGKPHRLLNAITRRIAAEPSRSMRILTALSLTPPDAGDGLQRRFLQPFLERHFGADFPVLDYAMQMRAGTLPANIRVEEFYFQSGALLRAGAAQRDYVSLNYTHVARAVAAQQPDVLVQKVAREPGGTRLSLSSNPDLTFDLLAALDRIGGTRPLLVAEIDPNLPWLDGPCAVAADFFDLVVDLPGPAPRLFALPREPVGDADHAIGLYASALVRDGGTLQIGIGSLADALCHALVLRHTRGADYLAALEALQPGYAASDLVRRTGGTAPFAIGLYGASEMVNDGFRVLAEAGVLSRRVVDDAAAMVRINHGDATIDDQARLAAEGRWLDGAFYLGSHALYDWLRDMPPERARGIGMLPVSQVNELYGGGEALERAQRRDARFFNTCMMTTALGAAVSDALDDGRVVSGVGGQYNFVAMAHALHDARSILMFRATRGESGSNVVWNYGHTTIPRHLRDIAISEYGVADLRGRSDGECVERTLAIADAGAQSALVGAATAAGKLPPGFAAPASVAGNTRAGLAARLRPLRRAGVLPDYPAGSDFSAVEQRLVPALAWLKQRSATRTGRLRLLALALVARTPVGDAEALARMALARPSGLRERIEARLLRLALARSAVQDGGSAGPTERR